ncbi:uncharacterized protein A1O9_01117 [Exophiala aquamarina CBS 119918]|uniref:Mitochondrial large ribosomal subunit n=1 Tax=Exophiala aquamarina CBS 119918 TaxID=1182545 RepID=A0A072PTD7_9EURO|nr:uncharacterized protein A1O9_01117 [Exophiala aquamarina CBS 119918]KEF63141.1 hypothetical protein A1O9_01117 [Exophiala aquamarina CBS 119918]
MKSQQTVLRHICRGMVPTLRSPKCAFLSQRLLPVHPATSTSSLPASALRAFHSTPFRYADTQSDSKSKSTPATLEAVAPSPANNVRATQAKVQEQLQQEREREQANFAQGQLAQSSIFFKHRPDALTGKPTEEKKKNKKMKDDLLASRPLSSRNTSNMALVLNPRPVARSRWQRKMVIRHIQRRGRLTKEMQIARTERSHMSRSHFFKTSMKKLAPLTRQIAGKSLDEAILQMRFSRKKVAKEVREHLLQARNEAITAKGMGLKEGRTLAESKALIRDPSQSRPLPHETPMKTKRQGITPDPTEIYLSEAWTNRGPYGREPDYRARGRANVMRPPYTGMTVVLKEQQTKTRIAAEKEAKALKKRLQKKIWVQLPDRPVVTQRQHLLW